MPRRARPLDLTAELITAAFPEWPADDHAAMPLLDDAALAPLIDQAFAPIVGNEPVWVFGYGALLWKPDFPFAEQRHAMLRGWHRRFCLWQWRFRGTPEHPSLMLGLDRGGACRGLAFRIDPPEVRAKLEPMVTRELRGDGYRPRWFAVETKEGPLKALGFVINHASPRYAGRLSDDVVASYIASACGNLGPSADYLRETAARCHALGIEDRMLLRVQALVAQKLSVPR